MEWKSAGRRIRKGKLEPDLFREVVGPLCVCLALVVVDSHHQDMAMGGWFRLLCTRSDSSPWLRERDWLTYLQAMRNLNAVTVPAFVSVPKNEEEDAKKGNQDWDDVLLNDSSCQKS